jgi:hypothetical protein
MSCVIEMGYRNTNRKVKKQSTSRPSYTLKDAVTTPATRKILSAGRRKTRK